MIAFIHTSPSMIPVFKTLADELLTGQSIFNMVDESLLCDIIRDGRPMPQLFVGNAIGPKLAEIERRLASLSTVSK